MRDGKDGRELTGSGREKGHHKIVFQASAGLRLTGAAWVPRRLWEEPPERARLAVGGVYQVLQSKYQGGGQWEKQFRRPPLHQAQLANLQRDEVTESCPKGAPNDFFACGLRPSLAQPRRTRPLHAITKRQPFGLVVGRMRKTFQITPRKEFRQDAGPVAPRRAAGAAPPAGRGAEQPRARPPDPAAGPRPRVLPRDAAPGGPDDGDVPGRRPGVWERGEPRH